MFLDGVRKTIRRYHAITAHLYGSHSFFRAPFRTAHLYGSHSLFRAPSELRTCTEAIHYSVPLQNCAPVRTKFPHGLRTHLSPLHLRNRRHNYADIIGTTTHQSTLY